MRRFQAALSTSCKFKLIVVVDSWAMSTSQFSACECARASIWAYACPHRTARLKATRLRQTFVAVGNYA